MNYSKKPKQSDDMLDEYDFSSGVHGKYAKRFAEGTNIVVLDRDIANYFPDSESVNSALRTLVELSQRTVQKSV